MLYQLGLYNLGLYVLTFFGLVQAEANVHDVFTLLKKGNYQEAIQYIRKAKRHEVMDAHDEQEHTLLIAALLYGDMLDSACTPQQKYLLLEDTIDCILDKTEFSRIYIDRRDTHWQTPLMHAVKKGYEDLAEFLYIHGADPRMKDEYGKTARDYATIPFLRQSLMSWEWEYVEMMREATNVWALLRRGMYNAVHSLIAPQLSDLELISMRDRMGNSLIIAPILFSFAISQDVSYPEQEEMILRILNEIYENIRDQEAKVLLLDVQNKQGQNAMMWAAKYGHEEVVHWLHERGADMLLKDKYGRRASDYATYKQLKDYLEDRQIEQQIGWRMKEVF